MNAVKEDVIQLVEKELKSANEKFPLFHSEHEGYAVIKEEIEEAKLELDRLHQYLNALWEGIRHDGYSSDFIDWTKDGAINLATEAIQVAAMAQKFIDSMEGDKK